MSRRTAPSVPSAPPMGTAPWWGPGAVAAAALMLAACATTAPRDPPPAPPVASAFPEAVATDAAAPAEPPRWQDLFGRDPRLARLIALALESNRDLRVAAAGIEAARATADVRAADRLPTVGVGVQGQRTANAPSLYSAGLQVTAWEADLFGRIRSSTDAALARLAASEEARRATQVALVAQVASQHAALAADDRLVALTEATLQSRSETLRLVQLRFDLGVASEIDLRLAQTAVESARAALAQQQRQRLLDRNALELLVGQPLPADLPPATPWDPNAFPDVPAGLPATVLLARPDVRQAEAQLRAAQGDIGAARAAFFPRITLTGSAGFASRELGTLFSGGGGAWTFVAQLVQPIFDAGRNRANLRLTEAQRDAAVAQYERAIQQGFREVADALAGRATLTAQVEALTRQTEAEAARLRLTELRWRNGVASSLELLDAQRSLAAVDQQRVQAELARVQNRVALVRALGGGVGP